MDMNKSLLDAARSGDTETVKALVDALRADVRIRSVASSARTEDCRAWGADLNAQGKNGDTALSLALDGGHAETAMR